MSLNYLSSLWVSHIYLDRIKMADGLFCLSGLRRRSDLDRIVSLSSPDVLFRTQVINKVSVSIKKRNLEFVNPELTTLMSSKTRKAFKTSLMSL